MILLFLAGSATFHLLYYMLKTVVLPASFSDEKPEAVVAEIAKRSVVLKIHAYIHTYTRLSIYELLNGSSSMTEIPAVTSEKKRILGSVS